MIHVFGRRSQFGVLMVIVLSAIIAGACGGPSPKTPDSPATMSVVQVPQDEKTISAAIDRVKVGGLVVVSPGTYREAVLIDKADVTLRGTDRNDVVIDGEAKRPYGVLGAADGVRVENLTATRATLYGVLITSSQEDGNPLAQGAGGYEEIDPEKFPALQRFRVDHVTASNNGLYGIYAFNSQHGVINASYASGSADSGIYVGQCRKCDIVVQGNVASHNAIGFENANASDSLTITGNRFSDNRVGLTLLSDYQEAFTPQKANAVFGNVVSNNDQPQSPRQADGSFGIGIGIGGGRQNVLEKNLIAGNPRAGVLLRNAEDLPAVDNRLIDNRYIGNGVDVANLSADHTPASGNCVEKDATQLPQDLGVRCASKTQPATFSPQMPPVTEPPGVSFLDVAAPGALPGLEPDDSIPDRLPPTVQHPQASAAKVPAATLLSSWVKTLQ